MATHTTETNPPLAEARLVPADMPLAPTTAAPRENTSWAEDIENHCGAGEAKLARAL
ncbi:MAG: hypothetical protein AAF153_01760 [Pseudomonadota bacterium]